MALGAPATLCATSEPMATPVAARSAKRPVSTICESSGGRDLSVMCSMLPTSPSPRVRPRAPQEHAGEQKVSYTNESSTGTPYGHRRGLMPANMACRGETRRTMSIHVHSRCVRLVSATSFIGSSSRNRRTVLLTAAGAQRRRKATELCSTRRRWPHEPSGASSRMIPPSTEVSSFRATFREHRVTHLMIAPALRCQ